MKESLFTVEVLVYFISPCRYCSGEIILALVRQRKRCYGRPICNRRGRRRAREIKSIPESVAAKKCV